MTRRMRLRGCSSTLSGCGRSSARSMTPTGSPRSAGGGSRRRCSGPGLPGPDPNSGVHAGKSATRQNVPVSSPDAASVTVTFAGSGDAFGSGGRYQACIHLRPRGGAAPVLLDCGATSLSALRRSGLDPGEIAAVFVSHLHGDHFGGLPFLILNGQFAGRTQPLTVAGPPGTARRLAETMECMFPGSGAVRRRFPVDTIELRPGAAVTAAGVRAAAFPADHPSGAPALALRLTLGGKVVAY